MHPPKLITTSEINNICLLNVCCVLKSQGNVSHVALNQTLRNQALSLATTAESELQTEVQLITHLIKTGSSP